MLLTKRRRTTDYDVMETKRMRAMVPPDSRNQDDIPVYSKNDLCRMFEAGDFVTKEQAEMMVHEAVTKVWHEAQRVTGNQMGLPPGQPPYMDYIN